MAFHIDIQPGSATPIYRQVVDRVRLAAATGELSPGQPMPSVRGLAERLVVNPNTIAKAYADLVREGVLESQPGRGLFVSLKKRQVYSRAERTRRVQQALEAFIHEAICLGFSPDEVRKAVDEKLQSIDRPAKPKEREP